MPVSELVAMITAPRLHVLQRRAGQPEVGVHVGLERAVEFSVGDLRAGSACASGARRWKPGCRARRAPLTVRSTAAIANACSVTSPGSSRQRRPCRLDRAPGFVAHPSALATGNDIATSAPFARVQHGDRAADARIAAGDERDLVAQLARFPVIQRLEMGPGIELRFETGLALLVPAEGRPWFALRLGCGLLHGRLEGRPGSGVPPLRDSAGTGRREKVSR